MRNPFALEDVPEPEGTDVTQFAASLKTNDAAIDENAMAWVTVATKAEGLDGAWSGRWKSGEEAWHQGVATLKVTGDHVYILFRDSGTYLVEARRTGERLVGRYINVNHPTDSSPWVGVIVDDYRIDGYWAQGRWDLRRCSPGETPEPIIASLLTEARQLPAAELRELVGFARYLRWRRNS